MSQDSGAQPRRGYFTSQETKRRLGALRRTMTERGLDGVLLLNSGGGVAFQEEFYFLQSDYVPAGISGFSATFVPRVGEPVVMSSFLQALTHGARSTVPAVRIVDETENPAQVFADILQDRGLSAGRIGWRWISVPAFWYQTLQAAVPKVDWVDVSAEFRDIEYQRTPEEADASARAAQIADEAYASLIEVVKPGMTEHEVVAEYDYQSAKRGANRNFTVIASGPLEPGKIYPELAPPSDRVLGEDDYVMMEMSPAYHGYYAQLVRVFRVGGGSSDHVDALRDVTINAIKAATDPTVLRPGATIGEVGQALLQSLVDDGYRGELPIGHTCGVDLVYDRLRPDNARVLHEGDAIIVHPRVIFDDGSLAFFWGETFLVTADGNRPLNVGSSINRLAGSEA